MAYVHLDWFVYKILIIVRMLRMVRNMSTIACMCHFLVQELEGYPSWATCSIEIVPHQCWSGPAEAKLHWSGLPVVVPECVR